MTSPTKRRTYSRETWLKARDAWDVGGFGPEWPDWRLLASQHGIIFPPEGTRWDSWGDDSPSQRALIIRAIRETPTMLREAIAAPGVRSWGDVIGHLLDARDEVAFGADRREREWLEAKERRPMTRMGDTLAVIGDSLGVGR